MAVDYSKLGKEVGINSVDKELRQLWEGNQNSSKASLINFAIYSEEEGSIINNTDSIQDITREHSCRAIIMELNRCDDSPEVKAWITAHCNLSSGTSLVCCEQVAFLVKGYYPGIVRHTLFSHLDSDLPLVVWWQGDLSVSFRERFYSNVDRFIFDSTEWDNLKEQYSYIIESLNQSKQLVVQDLAWTRTFHLRLALASLVDQPSLLSNIDQLEDFKITYSAKATASALLTVAWVAELLELKISEKKTTETGYALSYTNPLGNKVNFTLQATDPSDSAKITQLEAKIGDFSLSIKREEKRPLLSQVLTCKESEIVKMHCPADPEKNSELVTDQLTRGAKNALFRKILPQFIELI